MSKNKEANWRIPVQRSRASGPRLPSCRHNSTKMVAQGIDPNETPDRQADGRIVIVHNWRVLLSLFDDKLAPSVPRAWSGNQISLDASSVRGIPSNQPQ
jgi:hypothetical protein